MNTSDNLSGELRIYKHKTLMTLYTSFTIIIIIIIIVNNFIGHSILPFSAHSHCLIGSFVLPLSVHLYFPYGTSFTYPLRDIIHVSPAGHHSRIPCGTSFTYPLRDIIHVSLAGHHSFNYHYHHTLSYHIVFFIFHQIYIYNNNVL